MRHATAALVLALAIAACRSTSTRAPQPGSGPVHATVDVHDGGATTHAATPDRAPAPEETRSDAAAAQPAADTACTRDDECAVAAFEVSGPTRCCAACRTTPGTRRWYAALRRECAARPATDCPSLACPMGPTRAVCNAGHCEATWYYPDGGPALIVDRQRCLPEMVCDGWTGGCALVSGNEQNGWYIDQADHGSPGDGATVGRLCTSGSTSGCEGARVPPPAGVQCPPWSVPPLIGPAPRRCVMDGARCVAR